ncbi:alpha-amylase family glycosyl hydrolase [Glaciecola sp. 2405UD65-10]|uniref:alpha-amylase family glycosyl hydrolase n=1 Tax=Glaciecola sp. 2405UD65-10 TaxID=3397244 RepID=UPI003B58F3B2
MNIRKISSPLVVATGLGLLLSACSADLPSQEASAVAATSVSPAQMDALGAPSFRRNIQDEVFYFVMPDRFHNAITENDNGDPRRPISFGGLNTQSKWAFHGGDIAGVEAKLDYIQGLGISSIWMTPILRNKAIQNDGFAHHGYWVVDFTEIDPHFGSNQDLKDLIDAAHKRGIKVFFDIITNHTADVIKYKECHGENGDYLAADQKGCKFISSNELAAGKSYTPFLLENEKSVKFPEWLNDTKYYNNQGDSFWQGESAIKGDFSGLDDIDTSNPEVIAGLTEVFENLISDFKPDGFRIDTVKHVDIAFWQSFGPAVIEHAQSIGIPDFFIFGEVYDGNPAGLSKFTTEGKLPSVLDFGFAFNTREVLLKNKPISQLAQLFDNDDYYRDHDSTPNELLNFLGNHDMGRIGHFIEQDLPNASEANKLRLSQLAHAFMFFSRGIPVVYYGDEQGFTGDGGDVDAREDMDPSLVDVYNDNNLIGTQSTTAANNFDINHPLYQTLQDLTKIRNSNVALRRGEHINRIIDNEKRIYGFSRIIQNDTNKKDFLTVFNFSNEEQSVVLNSQGLQYKNVDSGARSLASIAHNIYQHKAMVRPNQLVITLPPLSYTMLESSNRVTPSEILDIKMSRSYTDNNRVMLPFELSFANNKQLNIARIDIYDESNLAANEESKHLSFDTTFPYRAVLNQQQASSISKLKVVASNLNGQTLVKHFTLKE